MTLYDTDYNAWARELAALARDRSANALDWNNVAEELEDLGRKTESELRSHYVVLLAHLLKWLYQPKRRSRSGSLTIAGQRLDLAEHLAGNPSLQAADADVFRKAYARARLDAARQTQMRLETFPVEPPFTPAQARDDAFWPE